jgi:hypothetical protein
MRDAYWEVVWDDWNTEHSEVHFNADDGLTRAQALAEDAKRCASVKVVDPDGNVIFHKDNL